MLWDFGDNYPGFILDIALVWTTEEVSVSSEVNVPGHCISSSRRCQFI